MGNGAPSLRITFLKGGERVAPKAPTSTSSRDGRLAGVMARTPKATSADLGLNPLAWRLIAVQLFTATVAGLLAIRLHLSITGWSAEAPLAGHVAFFAGLWLPRSGGANSNKPFFFVRPSCLRAFVVPAGWIMVGPCVSTEVS
jgi:hypothetical protein